jgi:hypothetical protein
MKYLSTSVQGAEDEIINFTILHFVGMVTMRDHTTWTKRKLQIMKLQGMIAFSIYHICGYMHVYYIICSHTRA